MVNSVTFKKSINITSNYLGFFLSFADIQTIVSDTITSGALPLDLDGVYYVLTSKDVAQGPGFLTGYCGYHDYNLLTDTAFGPVIKFAFVGDPGTNGNCADQTISSPNNNIGADAMANVIAHELEEMVTDPNSLGWIDDFHYEVADKCNFLFGGQYTASNGSRANMKLGNRDYLIQQNWLNTGGGYGYCALSYVAPTALTVDSATGPYNSTINLHATLSSFGAGVNGKTVSFTLNNISVGSNVTDATGNAYLSVNIPASIDPGSYPGGVSASYAGQSGILATSSNTASLTVTQASQSINFSSPADGISFTYGDAPFSVTATAGSGLTVSFSTASASCSVSGTTVTITGAGTCKVQADQSGNTYYSAAPLVSHSFTINRAAPTVSVTGGPFT